MQTLSALLYLDFSCNNPAKHPKQAITAELYPVQDIFEFDQGHVTKNQPITVLVLLSESRGI